MRLLVETDIETWLSWGELVELRVRDHDLPHNQLVVSRAVIELVAKFHPTGQRFLIKNYPKDKAPRRIGVSPHIRDLLAERVVVQRGGMGVTRGGRPSWFGLALDPATLEQTIAAPNSSIGSGPGGIATIAARDVLRAQTQVMTLSAGGR